MSFKSRKHRSQIVAVNVSTLTVSWDLPTTRADGTAIGTITGQTVYYDTVSRSGTIGAYAYSMGVGDGTSTSKVITGLTSATTYYFAVNATSAAGESSYSIEVSGTTA